MVDTPGYSNQAVSNAVHAVIAANDALCLFRIGERSPGQSHAEAANVLKRACQGTTLERQMGQRVRQLTDVLQQKTLAQYYGKPIDPETARRVMKQAERFIRWVEDSLPQDEPSDADRDG